MGIKTSRSKKFVNTVTRNIPNYINGSVPDSYNIGKVFWSTLIRGIFTRIHRSYEIRAAGGTDDLGNSFPPLKKETIARRPIGRGELTKFGLDKKSSKVSIGDRQRGLLSPRENKEWKRIYSTKLNRLLLFKDETTAKEIAAASAWKEMKEKGAKTKLDTLGSRDVLIMRVTDAIYNSLEPAKGGMNYRPRKNQLVEIVGGVLTVGTLVDYAKFHNNSRPVIPEDISKWTKESMDIAFKAAMDYLTNRVL